MNTCRTANLSYCNYIIKISFGSIKYNMEGEIAHVNRQTGVRSRLLPAVLPVLLISVGYVDPGKWAATVEGGARFGSDLVALVLVFNLAAILYQYLSARISIVTGRDLAQVSRLFGDCLSCF